MSEAQTMAAKLNRCETGAFLNGVLIVKEGREGDRDYHAQLERFGDAVKAAMPGARIVLTGRIVCGDGKVVFDYRNR